MLPHRSNPKASTQGMREVLVPIWQFPKTSAAPSGGGTLCRANPAGCQGRTYLFRDASRQTHPLASSALSLHRPNSNSEECKIPRAPVPCPLSSSARSAYSLSSYCCQWAPKAPGPGDSSHSVWIPQPVSYLSWYVYLSKVPCRGSLTSSL